MENKYSVLRDAIMADKFFSKTIENVDLCSEYLLLTINQTMVSSTYLERLLKICGKDFGFFIQGDSKNIQIAIS